MKLIHRLLLVWLLLLALPFQGIAAAGMLVRMPSVPMSMPAAAHKDHCAAMARQDARSHDYADKYADKHTSAKSGSCADCCAGAAMAPMVLPALVLAPPHFISIPFRAGHVPSVDPALPDRPPMTTLA